MNTSLESNSRRIPYGKAFVACSLALVLWALAEACIGAAFGYRTYRTWRLLTEAWGEAICAIALTAMAFGSILALLTKLYFRIETRGSLRTKIVIYIIAVSCWYYPLIILLFIGDTDDAFSLAACLDTLLLKPFHFTPIPLFVLYMLRRHLREQPDEKAV